MSDDFPFTNFSDFYNHLIQLYQAGQFTQALDEAAREVDRFPALYAPMFYHVRACLAACAGDDPQALRLLGEAISRGAWYNDLFWDDADFSRIKDDPEFQRLRALSTTRCAAAHAAARPLLELKRPAVGSAPYPLLLTLHGNQQNNEVGGPPWFPALEQGWMLGLVQSSQVSMPDAFEWDNRDIREKELREHYAAACRQAPVDEQRVVIGGYSLGGEAAIVAALNGVIPLRGFIVVVPGGPITTQPEQYAPMIEAARERGLRGGVIIGGRDRMATQTRTLVEMLRSGGIPCELADYKDMGHEFPPDFSIQLAKMLNFVLGG